MDESIIFDLVDICKYIKPTWMKPHQLTGLIWSFDTFDFIFGGRINEMVLPSELYEAYQNLNIPFRIRPGFLLLSLVVQNKKEEKKEEFAVAGCWVVLVGSLLLVQEYFERQIFG
jgi:hypothetical protein